MTPLVGFLGWLYEQSILTPISHRHQWEPVLHFLGLCNLPQWEHAVFGEAMPRKSVIRWIGGLKTDNTNNPSITVIIKSWPFLFFVSRGSDGELQTFIDPGCDELKRLQSYNFGLHTNDELGGSYQCFPSNPNCYLDGATIWMIFWSSRNSESGIQKWGCEGVTLPGQLPTTH